MLTNLIGVAFFFHYEPLASFVFMLQGRTHIFKIHARSMSVERDIRFELLARLCPNSTGKLNSPSHFFFPLLSKSSEFCGILHVNPNLFRLF